MINEIIDEKASSKQNIRKFIKTITSAPDYVKPVFRLMLREVSTGFATIPEDAIKYIIELFKLVRKLIILPGIERDSLNEKDPFLSHAFLLSSTLFLNVIPEVREKIISKADVKGNFSKSRDEIIDQYIELIFYGFYGKNEEEV
ncbi:MAG: hypothetical protein C0601_13370 [Candidatus Muiribacterium halophilum]|uniref:Transcriptional regulator TetR C-terminal Proteobacteria type domain-containing protein n=1 Tax=Muiribacterium halophilum TaxID=2053465 RepID=A0A2N5Z9E7_MUIH1|nr:MAG: hypothetical protein C0601_13370 [Candidatus Muirbacterium halophilum]